MIDIITSRKADRFLRKLNKKDRSRIDNKIMQLSDKPIPPDSKILSGSDPIIFRIRVGKYRILYRIIYEKKILFITKINKRSRAYSR